jgi:GIY-YIG catalytic domain
MAIGIYKVVNLANNKFYIGSSVNLNRRKAEHKYRRKLKRGNSILRNAVLKYGEDNFKFEILEILEYGDWATKDYINDSLSCREQYYIDTLNPQYNIRLKDVTTNSGWKVTEKQRLHLIRISKLPKTTNGHEKPILELDKSGNVIREWKSIKEATDNLNLSSGAISRVLSKEYSHTKNHYFKYKN